MSGKVAWMKILHRDCERFFELTWVGFFKCLDKKRRFLMKQKKFVMVTLFFGLELIGFLEIWTRRFWFVKEFYKVALYLSKNLLKFLRLLRFLLEHFLLTSHFLFLLVNKISFKSIPFNKNKYTIQLIKLFIVKASLLSNTNCSKKQWNNQRIFRVWLNWMHMAL